MSKIQKDIFLNGEGDQWFLRNKEIILSSKVSDDHLLPIVEYLKPGMKVLEIGSSFGSNLNILNNKIPGLELFGLDPSGEAINAGKNLFPDLKLNIGTAEDIDSLKIEFDFIFFGFCLYLIDRESLESIVSKVNQALKPGGYIGIIDFDTKTPLKNAYSHYEGVYSYKMDYSQLFLKLPNYFLVSKKSWSHEGPFFHIEMNERCSTQVLFKELN